MVIQRIQSVYLLIAAILMALVCFVVPVGSISSADGASENIYIVSLLPLLILNLLTAIILLIDIFMYKKLKLQMSVARICIVLILCSAAIEGVVLYSQVTDIEVKWIGSAVMLLCSLVLSFLALRAMNSDYKLLTSYNRLR